ncbi:MAG TPA: adhesin [Nitrosomonas sp.]|nr:adhesin [Nitrosomonas sp.]HNP25375.1 adhesin [Nitrosomonas sp.]
MKLNQKIRRNPWIFLASAALAAGLASCGGGDSGSGGSSDEASTATRVTPTGAATGVLMDSPVSGVSYNASSGKKGVTDEAGHFDFNYGDTVEFKLGGLTLGKVKGAPVVTPMDLADGNDNKLSNLLVLLQSLDADADPSNGIVITETAASAVSNSIKLNNEPEVFAASSELQGVLDAAGIEHAAKTVEEASEHFMVSGVATLGTQIWVNYNDRTAYVLRVAADGSNEYLQGQASPDDSCDENRVCGGRTIIQAGVEHGVARAIEFDARGFKVIGETTIDTNLKAGLSDPGPTRRIRTDGLDMINSDIVTVQREREQKSLFGEMFHIAKPIELSDENEVVEKEIKEARFSKIENDPDGIVGAWAYDADAINTKMLVFFPNNRFMSVDPIGEASRENQVRCAKPGVEFANFDYNKGANQLKISSFTYNTDGCIGFSGSDSNAPHGFTISSDGNTAKLEKQGEEPITVYRVSG